MSKLITRISISIDRHWVITCLILGIITFTILACIVDGAAIANIKYILG